MGPVLEDHAQFSFAAGSIVHPVYHTGLRSLPAVLVMQELPGFAPGLQLFAGRLAAAGFQVYLPWLFGPFNARAPVRNYLRLCISSEFARLQAGISAPITGWLRALVRHISEHNGDQAVAAIGMCVTGGFVIPLLLDPQVVTAVAAQPAIPLSLTYAALGVGGRRERGALNVAQAEIDGASARLEVGEARLLAVRCRADRFCPPEKMARLMEEFPKGLTVREYGDESTRNAQGQRPHATYTKEYRLAPAGDAEHFSRAAFAQLVEFLKGSADPSAGKSA